MAKSDNLELTLFILFAFLCSAIGFFCGEVSKEFDYHEPIDKLGKKMCGEHNLDFKKFTMFSGEIKIYCNNIKSIEDGYLLLGDSND